METLPVPLMFRYRRPPVKEHETVGVEFLRISRRPAGWNGAATIQQRLGCLACLKGSSRRSDRAVTLNRGYRLPRGIMPMAKSARSCVARLRTCQDEICLII